MAIIAEHKFISINIDKSYLILFTATWFAATVFNVYLQGL